MTVKRGRGRPPETWKHEIYSLIVATLRAAPGQDPDAMVSDFRDCLRGIVHGDPPAQLDSPWGNDQFPDLRRGMLDEARARGEPSKTLDRLGKAIDYINASTERATRLLARLVKQRSRLSIRWSLDERLAWIPNIVPRPAPPQNETRRACQCRPCRAHVGRSQHCVRGGPGLATWERGAFRVACILLGDEHAPKTFKVMTEKARPHV